MDALLPEAGRPLRFARELSAFTKYMRVERGLSPVTIATREERIRWLFASLPSRVRSLGQVTVGQIDAFLEAEAHRGWSRSSLHALGSSLRRPRATVTPWAGDTWHWVQTDASVAIRPLVSILAQRVSHNRAETDDPSKTIDESGEKPLGLDRRRVADWHEGRDAVGRTLHAAAANVQSISRLVLRNCLK
jgi:hypothetical protein